MTDPRVSLALQPQMQDGPQGMSPPRSQEEFQVRKQGWIDTINRLQNDPQAMMAMFVMGQALQQPGDSAGQRVSHAMDQGMQFFGNVAQARMLQKQKEQEQAAGKRKEGREDRRLDQEDRRFGLSEQELELRRNTLEQENRERDSAIGLRQAQAKKLQKETEMLDKGLGAKAGATERLIQLRKENLMKLNGLTEEEAFDKAIREIQLTSKAQSREQILTDLWKTAIEEQWSEEEMNELRVNFGPNPLELKQAPDVSTPVKVATPEEAAALPSGTRFMTPDGEVRIRK